MENQIQIWKDVTSPEAPPQSAIQFNETSNKTEFWLQVLEPELREVTPASFKPSQLLELALNYSRLSASLRLSAAMLRSEEFRERADIPLNAWEHIHMKIDFFSAEERERLAGVYAQWELQLCSACTLAEQAAGIPNN